MPQQPGEELQVKFLSDSAEISLSSTSVSTCLFIGISAPLKAERFRMRHFPLHCQSNTRTWRQAALGAEGHQVSVTTGARQGWQAFRSPERISRASTWSSSALQRGRSNCFAMRVSQGSRCGRIRLASQSATRNYLLDNPAPRVRQREEKSSRDQDDGEAGRNLLLESCLSSHNNQHRSHSLMPETQGSTYRH